MNAQTEIPLPPPPGCYDLSGAMLGDENDLAGRGPVEARAETPTVGGKNSAPGFGLNAELSDEEERELDRCEQMMEECLEKALGFGLAVTTIQRKRLYRKTHGTFEAYMEERWNLKIRQAYRLLSQFETLKAINGIPSESEDLDAGVFKIIAPESHTRPFYGLPLEHRKAAWEEAVATAPNGVMTIKHGTSVANQWKAKLAGKAGELTVKEADPKAGTPSPEPQPARLAEPQVKEMADTVIRSVRLLRDSIGTPDSANAANVTVALDLLEAYRDHLATCERRQAGRMLS